MVVVILTGLFLRVLSVTELLPMHTRSGQVREVVGLSFEAVFGVSLSLAHVINR